MRITSRPYPIGIATKQDSNKIVILAATSNYAEDSTETIAVASTKRSFDIVIPIEASTRQWGWER